MAESQLNGALGYLFSLTEATSETAQNILGVLPWLQCCRGWAIEHHLEVRTASLAPLPFQSFAPPLAFAGEPV